MPPFHGEILFFAGEQVGLIPKSPVASKLCNLFGIPIGLLGII
jgi:hypothetical protein